MPQTHPADRSTTLAPRSARTTHALAAAVVIVGSMVGLGGCAAPTDPVPYAQPFPEALAQTSVLDVQVILRPTTIELTNTSARSFGPSTLWLNRWYSRPIDGLAPGERVEFALTDFRDVYSDPFRPGGFFATKEAERLVQAQIETGEPGSRELVGLIVVGGVQQ